MCLSTVIWSCLLFYLKVHVQTQYINWRSLWLNMMMHECVWLSALASSGCFISEISLISFSLLHSLFLPFIPLILTKKKSSPRLLLFLLLVLLLLHLAYLFVSGHQCHTDSSVLCLSLVLYNEFCLGWDILQLSLYSRARREWEAWIRGGRKRQCG